MMKKAVRIFFVLSFLVCSYIFVAIYIMSGTVSQSYKVARGDELKIEGFAPVTVSYNGTKMSQNSYNRKVGDSFEVDLKLFGVIPFSTANVEIVDNMHVVVLGNPFGMKIYTDGVLVIESTDITTNSGTTNPATDAGIKVGDYIKKVDGKKITCNEDLLQAVIDSNGKPMCFENTRGGKEYTCYVTPVVDTQTGVYRIGIWVRDSSAGIGTLTFYSPSNNIVCGLGHGVCDSDTETLLQIEQGELVEAEIVSVDKGAPGSPGALKGKLSYTKISQLNLNSEQGVYGKMQQSINTSNLTEIALKQEIYNGDAQILCTIDGDTPRLYSCKIKKSSSKDSSTQNLIVTVTDQELIDATGGIVQGMSGSPVLQDGKLVGALTHVLVSDSHKGYAIYAENMLETAENLAEIQLKKAG